MLFVELVMGVTSTQAQFAVSRAYQNDRTWTVLRDYSDWHQLRKNGPARNAVYYGDWHADWDVQPTQNELERFLEEVQQILGL
jgi:hypothetical protein